MRESERLRKGRDMKTDKDGKRDKHTGESSSPLLASRGNEIEDGRITKRHLLVTSR